MAIRRPSGGILLQTKAFYPAGTFRLPTGGIKEGEDVEHALLREVHEESNLDVEIERLVAVIDHSAIEGKSPFRSYMFLLREVGGTLKVNDPDEQISGWDERDVAGLERAAAATPWPRGHLAAMGPVSRGGTRRPRRRHPLSARRSGRICFVAQSLAVRCDRRSRARSRSLSGFRIRARVDLLAGFGVDQLPKLDVAGSTPVARSSRRAPIRWGFHASEHRARCSSTRVPARFPFSRVPTPSSKPETTQHRVPHPAEKNWPGRSERPTAW